MREPRRRPIVAHMAPYAGAFRGLARSRAWLLAVSIPLIVAGLAGCGESKEEKAKKTVCAARGEIKKKVEHLGTITASSSALNEIKNEVSSIGTELEKIAKAEPDLSSGRKKEVEKATQEFTAAVTSDLTGVVTSLTSGQVSPQLKSALEKLVTDYKQALGPINCS
jgi:hypothetical protein